jgi:3'-phosphoadenosine 5'-phosphosulfate sulfotransferase (PAPS reductase)/FAD synthetase
MGENEGRVPIVIDPDIPCPLGNLKEAADGFTSMGEILQVMPAEDQRAARDFLYRQIQAGFIVWRDEWSPLRWCTTCNVPLLQEHCDRCNSMAAGKIELKFPCNPRPVLPHDEFMFKASGLPWPVDHSVVVNAYARPDYSGWELISNGRVAGEILSYAGTDRVLFKPSPHYHENILKVDQTTMDDVVKANRDHSDEIEKEAVEFIRAWCRKNFLTIPIMTFSGGKDSAVLAGLCYRSGVKMRVIQIDTGIDPVDNARYSSDLIARYRNLKLTRIENGDIFWRALEKLGPPASDFQWCRLILKLSAAYRSRTSRFVHLLRKIKPFLKLHIVLIDGPRRREEEWRKVLKRTVPIPESPAETTTIRPILDWTDLDIWIYLHRHEIPVNPTYYREKQQRLVCIFCPDKDRHELDLIREDAPGL